MALGGVDLAVARGEFVAVMGPSGCGKSTLLHLLGGLDRPSSGEVHLGDARLDTLSEGKRAVLRRRMAGFVFQFFNLISNLTVADQVELPALLAGVPAGEARRRERLLADEPTGNLDSQSTREVLTLLRRYHDEGQTVLLVTHDARVASAADRVITMRDGAIVDESRLSEGRDSAATLARLIALEV